MKIQILEPCLSTAKKVDGHFFLTGSEKLGETNHPNRFSGRNTVESTVEPENYFFYEVSHHIDARFPSKSRKEIGIGKLEGTGKLHREVVMGLSGDSNAGDTWFEEGNILTVGNFFPPTDLCKEYFTNAIFTSDSIIGLEPNQFLFCDAKGDLREGTAKDLHVYINSLAKPVPFNKGINIKPSNRPNKARIGDLIFNKNSAKLELYDGNEWKEIGQ